MKRTALFVSMVLATPALAQAPKSAPANPAVTTMKDIWAGSREYILRAAEQMPEADYAYRPAPDVRSFGQLIGHIAGGQYLFCAAALGEKGGSEDDIEKTKTTKAELLEALRKSNEYCARAYAQADADAQRTTTMFGRDVTRLYALGLNASHISEHYGNIVTYMRMKGMVPPSSQPRR
jgi:uncharacterized damage-inducible protein DinB